MGYRCPLCNGEAEVIWRSEDGKTVAIRCKSEHEYGEVKSRYYWDKEEFTWKYIPRRPRYVRGLVFLVEAEESLEEGEARPSPL